ncbi:MAG: C40 family peptidase [Acidobacteriota bacterium]|jgi:cell wall-associated NlpC family hydrolase|nr:C40 family peptidase [Acidobacteriota bacterium]
MTRSGNFTPGRCKRPGLFALALILAVLVAGCASSRPSTLPPVAGLREKVVDLARHLAGLPYRYGGTDIDGFDCSGLVHYVFHCFGLDLPRTARAQARMRGKIKWKHARPGDVLAFRMKSGWHTAILVKKNLFVHAPDRGRRIELAELNAWWKRRLKAVVDVIDR